MTHHPSESPLTAHISQNELFGVTVFLLYFEVMDSECINKLRCYFTRKLSSHNYNHPQESNVFKRLFMKSTCCLSPSTTEVGLLTL